MPLQLTASQIAKTFNRRTIFRNISFSIGARQTLLITGRNGSGKSTLVKIISNVLSPTEGTVRVTTGGESQERAVHSSLIGLVSPYLQLYEEFTAEENLRYALSIRGRTADRARIHDLLRMVFLFERKDDPVRTFSSGMKQRMKYAFALVHTPPILILDEPTSNLDAEGIGMVKEILARHVQEGILVVATNDLTDVEHYDERVDLNVRA